MLTRVAALARELKVYLLPGFAERQQGRMYNTTVNFAPDGVVASRYSKSHTADDEPYNTKGTEFRVADTPLGRRGTLICFGRQLPETSRILTLRGAQFSLVPSWGSYGEMNGQMMRVRACENGVWLAFVHPRRCLIIDPRGNIVAKDTGEGDQIVMATISLRDSLPRADTWIASRCCWPSHPATEISSSRNGTMVRHIRTGQQPRLLQRALQPARSEAGPVLGHNGDPEPDPAAERSRAGFPRITRRASTGTSYLSW